MDVFCCPPVKQIEGEVALNKPEHRALLVLEALRARKDLVAQEVVVDSDEQSVVEFLISEGILSTDLHLFLSTAFDEWVADGQDPAYLNPWDEKGMIPNNFARRGDAFRLGLVLPVYRRIGFHCDDRDTPLYESTWRRAWQSAAASIEASRRLCVPSQQNARVHFVASVCPGHHAASNYYGGYCVVNNGAAAAAVFRQHGHRVAILDLDYHHGNGTEMIFSADERVLTISLHVDPKLDYPYFRGFAEDNTASNLNAPLPGGTSWASYRPALRGALSALTRFNAESLVVAFGADTVDGDPVAGRSAGFSLQIPEYHEMGQLIKDNTPTVQRIVVTQEGGYFLEKVPQVLAEFLQGLH